MNVPIEVWGLISSYLSLNNLIEFSFVCNEFYRLSTSDSFYMKRLNESRKIFRDKSSVVSNYLYICDTFYFGLFEKLTPYVEVINVLKVKRIIQNKLFFAILPFCVWNHLWLCVSSNMCKVTCFCYVQRYI